MKNNYLKKVVDFVKEKKLISTLIAATLFIFASTFWYPFVYVAAAIVACGVIFFNFNDILCMFLYISIFISEGKDFYYALYL